MDADPWTQRRLLELQAFDTSLDRLTSRRRSLPELAEITDLTSQLSALSGELVGAETESRDLGRAQAKLEGEVDQVRSRASRDQSRLDSGAVGSPRELENLQSELVSLGRRQGDLEDQLLELMESAEAAELRAVAVRAQQAQAQGAREAAEQRRDAALTTIDAEGVEARRKRDLLAGQLPADLVALYEKVRTSSGGVGAAELKRRRCEGCHLELGGAEIRELAETPPQRVVRHEDCRRILIRTEDSGI